MSLLDGLVSHWKLNEASGTRTDSAGSNNLTSTNGVSQATGKIDQAAQLTAASSQYLGCPDAAGLRVATTGALTVAAWVYFDSIGANHYFLQKGAPDELGLDFTTADGMRFWISDGSGYIVAVDAGTGPTPSTATWYFLIGWFDPVANTANISTNNGTTYSADATGVTPTGGTGSFFMGAYHDINTFMDGRLDSVSVWNRVLTSGERTSLYNGGAGFDYPFTVPVIPGPHKVTTGPTNSTTIRLGVTARPSLDYAANADYAAAIDWNGGTQSFSDVVTVGTTTTGKQDYAETLDYAAAVDYAGLVTVAGYSTVVRQEG